MLNASCNDFEDIMVKRKIMEKLKNSSINIKFDYNE